MDGATKIRVPLKNLTINGTVAQLVLANRVPSGSLEVAGSVDNSFKPPTEPVTAQDDSTRLAGDYDSAAGGDFVLPFSQTIIG